MRTSLQRRGSLAKAVVCLAVGLWAASAQAQQLGRISGTVTDSTRAAVPGVTVVVTHDDTRLTKTTVTDGQGAYLVVNLPVGRYTVTAELQGFKKMVKSGHDLVTDGRLTVNFMLEMGALSDTVEVVAQVGETVNTVSGEIARVIDGEQVQDMALNGRNYMELATLIPGAPVLNEDPISNMIGLGVNTSINGARTVSNNLSVDGVFNMDSGSNSSQIINVGVDFIDQVNMKTSNFSAEYGRQSGANINVTIKAGTNRVKGGARWFTRDEKFDATNPSVKRAGLEKAPLDFDTFGWNVYGPIRKDKLFFHVGQEYKLVRQFTGINNRTIPTTAELRGDFSGRRNAQGQPTVFLRDPLKAGACSATDQTACFSNPQQLPQDRITPDGRAIIAFWTRMQQEAATFRDTPTGNNATYTKPRPYDQRQYLARLDYNANERHRLTGRILIDNYEIEDPYGTFIGSDIPNTPTLRDRPSKSVQLAHVWTLSPSISNDFRVAAAWNSQRMQPVGDIWAAETYGFQYPQVFPGGGHLSSATPRITTTGFVEADTMARGLISPTTNIEINDKISFVRGAHSFVAGGNYTRNRKDQNARTLTSGHVTFNPSGNPNSTGNALADSLLGNFRTYTEAEIDLVSFFRFSQVEAFVSDNWRVSRNLSLELGLRYQWHLPIYTQANNITNFDPSLYDPAQAVRINPSNGQVVPGSGNRYNGLVRAGDGVPSEELSRVPFGEDPRVQLVPTGAPRGLYNGRHNLMPRLSFAWLPTAKDTFAIRGGVGIFHDRTEGNMVYTTAASPPWNESVAYNNANLANPSGGSRTVSNAVLGTIEAIDPNLKVPRVTQWSLSVQRELFGKLFGEIAYVGSKGSNLIRRPNINQISAADLRLTRALPTAQRPNDNSLRPYLGYSTINMYLSDASSDYRALQAFVAKRRGDFTFTLAYTWSRSRCDACSRTDDGIEAGDDVFDGIRENFGVAGNHRPHILAIGYTYKLPAFKKSRGVAKTLLHGWEITGQTNKQSGAPLDPVGPSSIGSRRADYLGGPVKIDNPTEERMFNTEAFAPAPEDRKGNAPRGIIIGPGFERWTVKLRKRTQLPRGANLIVELDAFNVFNMSRLGNPNVDLADDNFGEATSGGTARTLQLGARLTF